ncbi:MAG: competence/damage-inducible protein A [candidate division NC10 bacterium]|nr:competence/damage-inducible protein A [candidate division NC10 bacterium]
MPAEIITIGTELLIGQVLDTNAASIASELMAVGIEVHFKTTVGDNERSIEAALRQALERSDIVIATGGLGPTEDDLTKKVFSRVLEKRLILHDEILEKIRHRFSSRGLPMSPNNEKQALIPRGAKVLENPRGTAPGLLMCSGSKTVVALPGVPSEMRPILVEQVIPYLCESYKPGARTRSRILKTCSIGESVVDQTLGDLIRASRNPTIGLLAYPGEVHIRLTARGSNEEEVEGLLSGLEGSIRERLGGHIFGRDAQTLEEVVGLLLREKGRTLALAESCTGGLIGHRLTNVPGSSDYFERAVVAYSNRAMEALLGVPPELLRSRGAVSREVAEAMATGVRRPARTHLGLGVTGIAGPSGGSPEKPVGLVYIALATEEGVTSQEHRILGDREVNKFRASQMALEMVRRYLLQI